MGISDFEDDGFTDFLKQIIDLEGIEGSALGITKQVIDKGEDSLSDQQRFVFNKQVIGEFTIPKCSRCESNIPWSEMYDAATEHGMCNYCWHVTQKDD